ncbi:MAG TPA: NAD(P)H-hydrate dehydratase [Bryobacteraceae bacterium]|nr:NAD(P)H-hydrate dehydratase [Bryobacteraceae bacterium]
MRVLTTAQAQAADLAMFERGIPLETLMERAGSCLFEFLEREFARLWEQRVVVFCGAGNNGGDGLVLARLLERRVAELQVVNVTDAGDAYDRDATIVVDALLGTGFREPVDGRLANLIRAINDDFPKAKIVAVDVPSAMLVRADYTVTFAAPKAEMLMSPRARNIGKLVVADIGIAPELLESGLELSEAHDFRSIVRPRASDAHKGNFGHVLVVGGAAGKTGAAGMAGLAALKAGAGLVTVACSSPSRLAPELMTQPLDEINLAKKTVLAIGPGLGVRRKLVARLLQQAQVPTVIDADGLNSLAKEDGTATDFQGRGIHTILTPHPGEMARLSGLPAAAPPVAGTPARDGDRINVARAFAKDHNCCLVLKGYKTLIAFPEGAGSPDGGVWINPTGSPAMAKGGAGDILTGLIAGLVAQFPEDIPLAVRAAVWLHGRTGDLAAENLTEQCVLATDLLTYLPAAIRECR